jgi:F-type H+-transporting ATPase subunit alpha
VPVEKVQEYAANLLQFMRTNHPEIPQAIANQKAISNDIEASLKAALAEYNQSVGYEVPTERAEG